MAADASSATANPAFAYQSGGGLRPFIDLRQSAPANVATSIVSSAANSAAVTNELLTTQFEYLPYTSGQFTTAAVSVVGPDGFASVAISDTSATINWSGASDNAYPIAGYNVEYRPDGSAGWISAGFSSTTSASLGGLSAGTAYDVQMDAVDTQGNVGGWSQATNLFTTAALPPTSLSSPADLATNQSTTPTFTWAPLAGAADGYRVIVDTNPSDLPTTPSGAAGATAVFSDQVTGTGDVPANALQPNTTYYWEVQGRSSGTALGAWSSIGSFTTTPLAFTVSGNGQAIPPGSETAGPAGVTDFGTVVVGSAPARESFTIQNTGDATLTLTGLKAPAGFSVVSALPRSLAVGHSATFTVRLNTGKLGTFNGPVSFANNDPSTLDNPFTFLVSGTVVPKPAPAISVVSDGQTIQPGRGPASSTNGTDFGSVAQASAAPTSTFTIQNNGNADLTLGNVRVPRGFVVIEAPPRSIAPGASGTFTLGLSTARPGTFGGVATFSTNDPHPGSHPFDFIVRGVVMAGTPELAVSANGQTITPGQTQPGTADGTDFGSVVQGGAAVQRTFTIQNAGNGPLAIGAVKAPPGFTVLVHPPRLIAAGAGATFTLRLNTLTPGTFGGFVSLLDDDPRAGLNPFAFAVTGTVAPKA